MTDLLKLDAHLLDHPKVKRMATSARKRGKPDLFAHAVCAFVSVLCLNRSGERDGELPEEDSDPEIIGTAQVLAGVPVGTVSEALELCIEVGLLERVGTERLAVAGWDDFWRPPLSEAERARKSRASQRSGSNGATVTPSRPARDKDRDTVTTGRHDAGVTCHEPTVTPSRSPPTHPPTYSTNQPTSARADARDEGGREGGSGSAEEQLATALGEAGVYTRQAKRQRELASRLTSEGMIPIELADLVREASSGTNPTGLLASWLDEPGKWREVLDGRRKAPGPIFDEQPGGRVVPDQAETQRRLAHDRALVARAEWEAKHLPKPPGLRATPAEREAWQRDCERVRAELAAKGNRPPEVPS